MSSNKIPATTWSGGFAKNPQLFPAVLLSDINRAFCFGRKAFRTPGDSIFFEGGPLEHRAVPFLEGGPFECRVILFLEGGPAKAWRFNSWKEEVSKPFFFSPLAPVYRLQALAL